MKIWTIYLVVINIYAFWTMYVDKEKAKKKQWRVSEMKIFLLAFLFGSLGVFVGMRAFRHKTKHWKFVIGIPLILILQLIFLYGKGRFLFQY